MLPVLHVTLANWQGFGFEFHLRSSPSAYSGLVNISRPAEYFTACYTVQQGRNSYPRLQFGFQFGLYCVVAPLSFLRSISLASLLTGLFLADQIFYRSYVIIIITLFLQRYIQKLYIALQSNKYLTNNSNKTKSQLKASLKR